LLPQHLSEQYLSLCSSFNSSLIFILPLPT
jgi:hypothetical protein